MLTDTELFLHVLFAVESSENSTCNSSNACYSPQSKIRISVGGEIFCPHLGEDFLRGNIHHGRYISQESAASLPVFRRKQVPTLVYDASKDGFEPSQWRFHVNKNEGKRLFLEALDQDGDGYSNMVHVHRSRNEEENQFLYASTSKFIRERNAVRTTKGWGGIYGKMVGIGSRVDRKGVFCDFVIKPEFRKQWSREAEKVTLQRCGDIFKRHFSDKPVGFNEMIEKQKFLWPMDCPDELTDFPQCWNGSLNLGNELHNDNDGTRSFAVWVSNNEESPSTSWYLLFPQWEVAIELCHGTWISWNGRVCGHCSALPNVINGEELVSLFCSIPQKLCDHLGRIKQCFYMVDK